MKKIETGYAEVKSSIETGYAEVAPIETGHSEVLLDKHCLIGSFGEVSSQQQLPCGWRIRGIDELPPVKNLFKHS